MDNKRNTEDLSPIPTPTECPEFGKDYDASDPACAKCKRAEECQDMMAELMDEEAAPRKENWWKYDRHMTQRLADLKNGTAAIIYLFYRDSAWNKEGTTNEAGMAYGESFLGNKKLAEKTHVGKDNMNRFNKILIEAGLVAFVRQLSPGGPWVKRIAMTYDEVVQGLPTNRNGFLMLDRMPTPLKIADMLKELRQEGYPKILGEGYPNILREGSPNILGPNENN